MRTGLTKQEKSTDIWFDEKDSLIHIRTHNTDLKKTAIFKQERAGRCLALSDALPFDKMRFFRLYTGISELRPS